MMNKKPLRSDYSIHSKDNGSHQVESTEQKESCVRGVILFKSYDKKVCEKWIKDRIKGGKYYDM